MNVLILLRGLPGTGKSTLATSLAENKYPVISVDDYFINPHTQTYVFEFAKNHLAYKSCEERTEAHMKQDTPKIFIANTFTMDWELTPYFKLANTYKYQLHVVTVEKYHSGKNVHDVTEEQLNKMAEKYKVKLL
jgi:predicted kinase